MPESNSPRRPAPQLQPISVWPTPQNGDFMFYVERDARLPKNIGFTYGSAFEDAQKYPDHKLVYVAPQDEEKWSRWYYVNDRIDQDAYNWEFSQADIGGTKFNAITRTYITPRASFTPLVPLEGTPMATAVPGATGTYILAERKQGRSPEREIDNLYVVDVHTYIQRVTISDVVIDLQTGNSKRSITILYYRGEIVTGSTTIETLAADPNNAYWGLQVDGTFRELEQLSDNWFAVTESNAIASGGGALGDSNPAKTRVVTRPTPLVGDIVFSETGIMPSPVPAYGTAHYNEATYPNHKLALIRPADKTGLLYEFVYVADRSSQDLYNAEFTQADIGGQKFNAIQRTYVTPRASFNPDSPAQGTTMATALSGAAGTYLLAERKQTRSGDQEIDNLYVIDVHTYVKRSTIAEVELTKPFRVGATKTTTLYFRGENTGSGTIESLIANPDSDYWKVQADGSQRVGQQLTEAWFSVLTVALGTAGTTNQQDAYNWEFSQADIGGMKFNAIVRAYITLRSAFSATTPAQGATIASVPGGASGTYILAERKQTRPGDSDLDNFFVIDTHTYVKRATLSDINTDPTLGVGVQTLTTLYYRGEGGIEAKFADPSNAYWGIQTSGINREGRQLTDNWFAVIETSSREDELEAYMLTLPTSVNLDLPDVLQSVTVVWNKAESSSSYDSEWNGAAASQPDSDMNISLGGEESASASASASLQPDINVEIKTYNGRGIPAVAKFFFMKLVNGAIDEAAFLAKAGADARWPIFRPEAHSIICLGQKVGVAAKADGRAQNSFHGNALTGDGYASHEKNEGSGTDRDFSTTNGVTRIPPTIHFDINIDDTTETATASASVDVGWTGSGSGEVIAGIVNDFPDVSAAAEVTENAVGLVTPSFLPETNPPEIPTSGLYLTEMRVQPSEPNWVQCYAEVVDAANIV